MEKTLIEPEIKEWLTLLDAQAKSCLNKQAWCKQNEIKRETFFRGQRKCKTYLRSKQKGQ